MKFKQLLAESEKLAHEHTNRTLGCNAIYNFSNAVTLLRNMGASTEELQDLLNKTIKGADFIRKLAGDEE